MANFISEDQIEKAIIEVFVNNLGYRHVNCIDTDFTGRENESEVVIKSILRKKIELLNKELPSIAIDEAMEQLCQTRLDRTEVVANKEIYNTIRNGAEVTINNKEGKQEKVFVKVIDFEDDSKNDYLVVSQLWLKGQVIRRRPDLIVYVNGLPLIFIELKNSNVAIRNAYEDNLTNYRSDIPLLFHYNVICILSNGL
ncbi:MAG TPA: type I restriction endonuclease, partial [Chryseolinea sp.]|nr:type I restriction endonuclease [Chryseolinea sp.]